MKVNKIYTILFVAIFFILPIRFTFGAEPTSDFLSLCKVTLKDDAKALPLCEALQTKFFLKNKTNDIAPFLPKDVGAPPSSIDDKVQFFIFNDPNYLAGVAYCYFVYRNWISPTEISPDTLVQSASGFSILNEKIKDYQQWLNKNVEGKKCKARVEKESEVTVADLEISLKGRVALIGINPYAIIQSPDVSLESAEKEMLLTVNHERIHAYHVACPAFEKWSIKEWEKLPSAKKNEYIKKYPSYTWSIPQVAGREYIGFLLESTPEKIADHIKGCKI